jgi:CBS domain containing-hemolysin-like protein
MNGIDAVLIALAILLGGASASFAAVETSIFSMSDHQRRRLRSENPARASRVQELFDRPDAAGNALMLGEALCMLPLIVILLHLQSSLGFGNALPGWIVGAILFGGVIILCDLLPKVIALTAPIRVSLAGADMACTLVHVLSPACDWFENTCERVVEILFSRGITQIPYLTDEELETLVEIGRDEGTLNPTESRIIREILRLEGKSAKHCMTPRVDAFFINDDLSNEDAQQLVRSRRLRRVPVRGPRIDDIEGILDVREFLLKPTAHYTERLQAPSFVPESMVVLDLLRAFLNHRQHLALLLDEFGGVQGVVTLSDIIEELLGEEGPDPKSELYIERLGPSRILAAGSARLDDIGEALGCSFEKDDIESIGGLVIDQLGALPRAGAEVTIGDWRIHVRRATRKRIKEVLIEPIRSLGSGVDAATIPDADSAGGGR